MAVEEHMADTMIDHDRAEPRSLLADAPAVRDQIERMKVRIDDFDKRARQLVKERPVVAVGTALLFGYVLGRLLARR